MSVSESVLLAVLVVSVVTDVATGKIKNWLTLPAIASGPIIHYFQGNDVVLSLAGIGVMILVGALLYLPGIMGAGDVKLLMAVGSLAGVDFVRDALLFTALAGGVLALIVMIRHRIALKVTKDLARVAWMKMVLRVGVSDIPKSGRKMPYAIAIAVGTTLAVFLPH